MTNSTDRYQLVGAEMMDVTDLGIGNPLVRQLDNGDPDVMPLNGLDKLEEAWARVKTEAGELARFPFELAYSVGSFAVNRARMAHQERATEKAGAQEGTGLRAGTGQIRY